MDQDRGISSYKRLSLKILSDQYGIPESELLKRFNFSNVKDSLDLVELVMEIEEELEPDA